MKILYFTGTGNCLNVCKKIGGELYSIPEMIKKNEYKFVDDKIGIVFPCYSFGMPHIVEQFLKKVEIIADYIFIIVTMGSKDKATLYSCEKLLNNNVDYMNHIIMVDNFVPMCDTYNELIIKDDDKIQVNIERICDDIHNNKEFKVKTSFIDKFITGITKFIRFKLIYGREDYFFYTNDKCNQCGICLDACPMDNISIVDNELKFNHNCESCMRCIHICPRNSLHVKFEKSDVRFINSHVRIKELK